MVNANCLASCFIYVSREMYCWGLARARRAAEAISKRLALYDSCDVPTAPHERAVWATNEQAMLPRTRRAPQCGRSKKQCLRAACCWGHRRIRKRPVSAPELRATQLPNNDRGCTHA